MSYSKQVNKMHIQMSQLTHFALESCTTCTVMQLTESNHHQHYNVLPFAKGLCLHYKKNQTQILINVIQLAPMASCDNLLKAYFFYFTL